MTKEELKEYLEDETVQSDEAIERWIVENGNVQDLDAVFMDLLCGIKESDAEELEGVFDSFKKNKLEPLLIKERNKKIRTWMMRAAAAAIVGVVVTLAYFIGTKHEGVTTDIVEYYTSAGDVKNIVLPDNTKLQLKPDSHIFFDRANFGTNRKVYLSGEAYMDVTKDKEHPFSVKCQGIEVQVTGTKFNVQSYSKDSSSEVMLYDGSVNVLTNRGGKDCVVVIAHLVSFVERRLNFLSTVVLFSDIFLMSLQRAMPLSNVSPKFPLLISVSASSITVYTISFDLVDTHTCNLPLGDFNTDSEMLLLAAFA